MGSMADYLENKVLDHVNGKTQFNFPGSLYVALYTVTPSDAGGGTEVLGGSYARLEFNGVTGRSFASASGGATSNAQEWTFPAATGDWGTIVAFAILDAPTGGNCLWWGAITPNKAVNSGDTAKFAIGDLDLTLD